MMKRLFFSFSIAVFLLSFAVFAQKPKTTSKTTKGAKTNLTKPKSTPAQTEIVLDEQEELKKARALTDPNEKIKALQKFVIDFPNSTEKNRALEIIVSTRAAIADEKLRAGETEAGIKLFKDAVSDAPTPISEQLFADIILQFPTNLFFRGQQVGALQVAQLIETKVKDNPKQLLGLATFYLGVEKANEARMLADAAINLDANLPAAYQTLGLAYRLNFQLEEAEQAYIKALELAPDSAVSKRSLAEMKRSTGKSDEAVMLYRELVEKDANDAVSQNGLILSLFDANKREEAETLLNKSLETTPNNLFLLVGAAYWYAAHNNGEKAIELAQKAVELEPRYTWGRIALARGLMLQKLPLEAEKILLLARQYGSFPTLDYELATARFQAGLFEEAARELKKRFAVKDGYVQTYIAGRVIKEAETFTELLSLERKASIFTPSSAENNDDAEKLKSLLDLNLKLSNKEATDEEINKATDDFTKGDDKMKTHRQIYAASRLLEAKKSLPKVLELTQGAVKGVDASLEVLNPAAAVLADELIESRSLAIARDEVVIIPEVPRQTLSTIIRGRIEELAGWTLYEQDKLPEAVVRFKRAISILPEKSAWWRSSYWKMGAAQEAGGNSKEALDAYIKSYINGQPDRFRRSTIENVYRKINGNTDGLEKLIGTNPFEETIAQTTETPTPSPTVEPTPEVSPSPTPEASPTPISETTPTPTPETKTESTPIIEPTPTPEIKPETTPTPDVEPKTTPTPETKTETTTAPKVETSPTPKPLFDPIIITVPKSDSSKSSENTEKTVEKTENKDEIKEPNKEENKEPQTVAQNTEKTIDPLARPRVVSAENSAETNSAETPSCVVVSQESISILSKGGNLGVLVGLNQDGDISKITAESSSSADITATLEPDIGRQSNRAFFVIKSISENKGVFTVTFTSPCGKKEIQVKVR